LENKCFFDTCGQFNHELTAPLLMENIKIGVDFLLDVSIVNPHELENQK